MGTFFLGLSALPALLEFGKEVFPPQSIGQMQMFVKGTFHLQSKPLPVNPVPLNFGPCGLLGSLDKILITNNVFLNSSWLNLVESVSEYG